MSGEPSNSGVWRRASNISSFIRNASWAAAALVAAVVAGAQHWTELQTKPSTEEVRSIVREEVAEIETKIQQHAARLEAVSAIEHERERSKRVQRYLVLHAQYMEAMIAAIAGGRRIPPRPADLDHASQALLTD